MALPIGSKIGYGAGQVGEGVKTAAFTYFLFFYYTQVLGLAPARAGLAFQPSLRRFRRVTRPSQARSASTLLNPTLS